MGLKILKDIYRSPLENQLLTANKIGLRKELQVYWIV